MPDKYKNAAPQLYSKLTSVELDDDLLTVTDEIVEYLNGFDNIRTLKHILDYPDYAEVYIGNEDRAKISKEDFMNLAGYSYDEYIKRTTQEPKTKNPEFTAGYTRKRKKRRIMKKAKKRRRVKTHRRR
jgi:hypothetical protein|tara:strand:+ start:2652 stop:3035 length:384 start_codon:yes stop_codon:yes gene_type:complete